MGVLLASIISLIPNGIPSCDLSFLLSNCLAFSRALSSSKYTQALTRSSFSRILSKQLCTHSYLDNLLLPISLIASVAVNSKGFVMVFSHMILIAIS